MALAKALAGGSNLNNNGTPVGAPSQKSEQAGLNIELITLANNLVDVLLDHKEGNVPDTLARFNSLKSDDQILVRTMVAQNVLRFQGHDEAAAEAILLVYPDLGLTINDQD